MSVTKQEPPAADPRKMDYEQLDALAQEALDSDNPTEYQYSVVEAYMEQATQRRMKMEVEQEAEHDLQRWLKWQREVGLHREFARDYARYMARISC